MAKIKTFFRNKYVIVTAPFLWMAWIFFISSFSQLPSPPEPVLNYLLKKTAHFLEYAILGILWYRFFNLYPETRRFKMGLSILVSVLYAISDEYHQSFVPGRQPKTQDVVIDTLGVILGLYLYRKKKLESF